VKPCYFVDITKAENSRGISQSWIKESLIVWVVADDFCSGASILIGRVTDFYKCLEVSGLCIACRG